jgi:hypothetical protein
MMKTIPPLLRAAGADADTAAFPLRQRGNTLLPRIDDMNPSSSSHRFLWPGGCCQPRRRLVSVISISEHYGFKL